MLKIRAIKIVMTMMIAMTLFTGCSKGVDAFKGKEIEQITINQSYRARADFKGKKVEIDENVGIVDRGGAFKGKKVNYLN